jgi:uncharacterized membrane protein YfcA
MSRRLRSDHATAMALLPFFVVLVFGNNLQHVYWTAAFRSYAPGVVTSALLGIPLTILVSRQAVRRGLVSRRYVIALYMLIVVDTAAKPIPGRFRLEAPSDREIRAARAS